MPSALLTPPLIEAATRREFLALLGAAGLLPACATGQPADPTSATRTFVDGLGRSVEVPVRAQRIVALQQFGPGEALLALNGPLIGMEAEPSGFNRPLARLYDTSAVAPVGGFAAVDAERIQTLGPDLIIAFSYGGEYSHDLDIELLGRIAPTVALDFALPRAEYQAQIAALAGLEDALAAQRREYEQRLDAVRAEITDPARLSVLTLGLFDGDVSVYLGPNPLVTVVRDLGLASPPGATGDGEYLQVSPERIADPGLQPDVSLYEDRSDDPTTLPLWSRLPAVAAGQAHEVPEPAGTSYRASLEILSVLRPLLTGADPAVA